MKLNKVAGLALASVLLAGCLQAEPEVKYVDVSTGKPIEVAPEKVLPSLQSHPTAPVPHIKSLNRYVTRDDGSFIAIDKEGKPTYSSYERVCVDGIVYLRNAQVLVPHLVRDTANHPLMSGDDSGSRVSLKGVTCQ